MSLLLGKEFFPDLLSIESHFYQFNFFTKGIRPNFGYRIRNINRLQSGIVIKGSFVDNLNSFLNTIF